MDNMDDDRNGQDGITFSVDDLYGKNKAVEGKGIKFIVFRLATEWYGVKITSVKEIIRKFQITSLPSVPNFIKGITNLRGNIVSVTNLKIIFNLADSEITEKSRLIVVEEGAMESALLVDEVSEVKEIPEDIIDPTLVTISRERAGFINGEFKVDDKLVAVLNIEKIFQIEIK